MIYQRINTQNGQPVGKPGPLPEELRGLANESLADLSWTNERLGNKFRNVGFVPYTPLSDDTTIRNPVVRALVQALLDAGYISNPQAAALLA